MPGYLHLVKPGNMNRLQALFYSKIRAELFRRLFSVTNKPVYLNQLRKDTGFALSIN